MCYLDGLHLYVVDCVPEEEMQREEHERVHPVGKVEDHPGAVEAL